MSLEQADDTHHQTEASAQANAGICVLGMHRSGTSLLASVLQDAGVRMGEQLLTPAADNPKGYFEDTDFVSFHEGCLSRRGLDYAAPGSAKLVWTDAERETASGLLESRRGGTPFGWKDPRTCVFAHEWAGLDAGLRFVALIRRPAAVAASLIRRGEVSALADAGSGLDLWASYCRPLAELAAEAPGRVLVLEADALLALPDASSEALRGFGIDVTPEQIEARADGESYQSAEKLVALEALIKTVAPEAAALWQSLVDAAAVRCPEPAQPDPSLAALAGELAQQIERSSAPGRLRHLALSTALAAADPRVSEAFEAGTIETRLREQLDAARANLARAQSSDAASKTNYERALAAEAALDQEHGKIGQVEQQRAEAHAAVEKASAALDESRAVAADLKARIEQARRQVSEAEAREQAAAAESKLLKDERTSAAARLAGLRRELDAAQAASADDRAKADALELAARNAERIIAELRSEVGYLEGERNYYRRRWAPFAAKRVVEKSRDKLRTKLTMIRNARALNAFGANARVAVFLSGQPVDPDRFVAAAGSQTKAIETLVSPGQLPGALASARTFNWWSPDLALLSDGTEYTAMLHPEDYGVGPLDEPAWCEMAAAALASDPGLEAIVYRGRPGAPALLGQYNHIYETDLATAERMDESELAIVFRSSVLREIFPRVNQGESRSMRNAMLELLRQGRRVAFAPRSFSTDVEQRDDQHRVASKLPAQPKAAIKAVYLTQWLECGGADKGAVDLLTRVNPEIAEFSCVTTVAAANAWGHRVQPYVREFTALADHLPLPDKPKFVDFLIEYIRRRDIGLVHIMHSFAGCEALPQLKAELPGVKVVDQNHILEPPHIMEGGHPAYSSRYFKQYFDHRSVTSTWLERYLLREHEIPQRDVSVIYTCIDHAEEFNPERYEAGHFRAQIGIENEPLIVFLGRLHDQKRPELFARVAAEVTAKRPDLGAVFALVGEGVKRGLVEAEQARMTDPSRLVLAGEVSRSQPVLRDADLMFMPSSHEGLAYVSYESMAMGVPQLFTDVNGQSELITPETGVLLPVDPDELVEKATAEIIALLDDRAKMTEMSRASRARVVERFGMDRLVGAYESIYQDLAAGRAVKRIEGWA